MKRVMVHNFMPQKVNQKEQICVYNQATNRAPWLAPSHGARILQDVGFPTTLRFKDLTNIFGYPEKVAIAKPRGHK
jgi:hypothetical protein